MKTPKVPQEEADQEIKRYFFVHGCHTGVDNLLERISVSRQTAFKWYRSVDGMILAGLRAAQASLTTQLEDFRQGLVAHPKLVIGRIPSTSGKRRTAVFAASTAAEVFGEYCRLLNDPTVCGGIVLRAAAEFPDPASKIHQFATECFIKHVEYLSEILKQEEVEEPATRARLLVAAAAGLFSSPRSAIGQETSFLPLFFQAITTADISRISGAKIVPNGDIRARAVPRN